MPLPEGISREHVEQAIAQLDQGVAHRFGSSKEYDLVFAGKAYPPKAVLGVAATILTGREVTPDEFSAGEGPGQTNPLLRSLGFDVIKRTDIERSTCSRRVHSRRLPSRLSHRCVIGLLTDS